MKLIGFCRLGRDAEVRNTADGTPVANLSLAFNYGRKDESGQRPTQWVDGTLWGKRADALAPYLLKGTGLVVTLSDVHIEEFDRRDGSYGSALRGRVDDVEFAGGSGDQDQRQAQPTSSKSERPPPSGDEPFDDDIPF